MKITQFRNGYRFLSNFEICKIHFHGYDFSSSEQLYQFFKTKDRDEKEIFSRLLTPADAKKYGNDIKLREDWEKIKDKIMFFVLILKFTQNPDLLYKLVNTGDCELVEGNYWHDNYWGDCECDKCKDIEGQNKLGKMLMRLRKSLSTFKNIERF